MVIAISYYLYFRLNRNSFDDITFLQFQELIMNTNHKISKLFFEWNELRNEIALPFYTQLALSPSIEFLILRSNSITDELFIPFCEKLIDTNNQTLKFLDVYDNLLTKKCIFILNYFFYFYFSVFCSWKIISNKQKFRISRFS